VRVHDERMKRTGQNGISGYDDCFINCLSTTETGGPAGSEPAPRWGRGWGRSRWSGAHIPGTAGGTP
jgi:hypothetical protein